MNVEPTYCPPATVADHFHCFLSNPFIYSVVRISLSEILIVPDSNAFGLFAIRSHDVSYHHHPTSFHPCSTRFRYLPSGVSSSSYQLSLLPRVAV